MAGKQSELIADWLFVARHLDTEFDRQHWIVC